MNFSELYADLYLPVLVCRADGDLPVVYLNMRASLLFAPSFSVEARSGQAETDLPLREMLRFRSEEEYHAFLQAVKNFGRIDNYLTEIGTFDGQELTVQISGKTVVQENGQEHIVFYLIEEKQPQHDSSADYDNRMVSIINASFLAEDVEASVQMVLSLAGKWVDVSRAYIFEEISHTTTRNTYEWCNTGVEPAIQGLQNLDKMDYPYDDIINAGMFITGDISQLPPGDRAVLEPQGIVALAIIPFYDNEKPLGYVGFDDCEKKREWSHNEIQFLKSISILLANLIKRRNAEQDAKRTREILQIISDHSEELVYANSLDDYSLVFVNRALAKSLGKNPEDLVGLTCYKTLQRDQNGPCEFCPIPHIDWKEGESRSEAHSWEFVNTVTGGVYFIQDRIIRWVDGTYVHVENATDITAQRKYEEQLQRLASTDTMTGVYNREWGARMFAQMLDTGEGEGSLCFIDLDGLKKVNDTLGHDAGDSLLVETVNAIQRHISPTGILCRWGGDEFLLWLGCPPEEAYEIMRQIQADMEQVNREAARPYLLSVSYGIAPFSPDGDMTLDAIVTMADGLMYENKMEKRGLKKNRRRTDRQQ